MIHGKKRTLALLVLFYLFLTVRGLWAVTNGWSFAVFGDTRGKGRTSSPANPYVNAPVVEAIAKAIANEHVNLVIFPGDLIYGQWSTQDMEILEQFAVWTNAMSAIYQAGIPVYPVRGNHEINRESGPAPHEAWQTMFGVNMPQNGPARELGMTYSFVYSNALFLGLDQYKGTNDYITYHVVNRTWLNSQLTSNTSSHIFVYGHEPAFEASEACLSASAQNRNAFWQSLGGANCRVYFCGHSHLYGRAVASISNSPALRQVIVGTGGAPLFSWDGQYTEAGTTGATIRINGVDLQGEDYVSKTNLYGYMLVEVSGSNVSLYYKATTETSASSPTWLVYDCFAYNLNSSTSSTPNVYVPVYRLYCNGESATYEHLFTTNSIEKDVLSAGPSWTYEGIAWYALGQQTNEAVPLYRLYCPNARQHHYTVDADEYAILTQAGSGWDGEGIQYYVFAALSSDTVPVYRFYNSSYILHHFTVDVTEKEAILANPQWGYAFEGVAYYVIPGESVSIVERNEEVRIQESE